MRAVSFLAVYRCLPFCIQCVMYTLFMAVRGLQKIDHSIPNNYYKCQLLMGNG